MEKKHIFFLSNNFHVLQTSATKKMKMKIQYKIQTHNYYCTLCLLKSNKAIKNMITVTRKIFPDESQYVAKWGQ